MWQTLVLRFVPLRTVGSTVCGWFHCVRWFHYWNWQFQIVAAGALQRMRKKRLAQTVGHIVAEALPRDLLDLHTGQLPRPRAQESGGVDLLRVVWVDLVSGDLLFDELLVGLVAVEGANDVIEIAPGIPTLVVVREA